MSSFISKVDELAKWIDTGVIAKAILETEGVKTVEQAKEVWSHFLAIELYRGLKKSADCVNKGARVIR